MNKGGNGRDEGESMNKRRFIRAVVDVFAMMFSGGLVSVAAGGEFTYATALTMLVTSAYGCFCFWDGVTL